MTHQNLNRRRSPKVAGIAQWWAEESKKYVTPGQAWKDAEGELWVYVGTEGGLTQFLSMPDCQNVVTMLRVSEAEISRRGLVPEERVSIEGQRVRRLWKALDHVGSSDSIGHPVVNLDD